LFEYYKYHAIIHLFVVLDSFIFVFELYKWYLIYLEYFFLGVFADLKFPEIEGFLYLPG